MMPFTSEELAMLAELEQHAIAAIERESWSDEPLTPQEKQIIGMTVSWTYAELKERSG